MDRLFDLQDRERAQLVRLREVQGHLSVRLRAGLKGCTTFRFNPEAFQGVLVKEKDLANTVYRFQLQNGTVIEAKGNDEIEYDGEIHSAANLYDALKEGYYGKY